MQPRSIENLSHNTSGSVTGGVRWVAIGTVFSRGIGLLSVVLVARVLGPKAMGLIALVMLVNEMTSLLAQFGLSDAIIHRQGLKVRQLATLYTMNWLLGITAFALSVSLAWPAAEFFEQPLLVSLIPVSAIGFLISPIGQQVGVLLRKQMQFRTLTLLKMGTSVISLIIAVAGVHSGFGVWALVYAGLGGSIGGQIVLIYIGLKQKMLCGFAFDLHASRELLAFGAYRTGAMSLNMVNSRADQFIIGATLGATALGFYSMASRWTLMTMQQLNSIATSVAFPAIARIQADRLRVRNAFMRLTNRLCTVNAAVFFGLGATAEPLVKALLGDEWLTMVTVLRIMCGYVLFRSLGNSAGPLITGLGKAKWAFYWNLALVFVIPTTLLAASRIGTIEAIVSSLLGLQIVLVFFSYAYFIRRLIGPCFHDYFKAIAIPFGIGALMAVIVYTLLQFSDGLAPLFQLAIAVPAGAIVYILLSLAFNEDAMREILLLLRLPGMKAAKLNAA